MPSLFNKRSRSVSTSRPAPSTSSSAASAAAQAFLANRQSQSNLSASAAATALRTMSPPPTPVDQVLTKRMVRRSSNASPSNAPRGRSLSGVLRKSSNGSMSERTFRSPSPGRPATAQGLSAATGAAVVPPVPAVPVSYQPIDDVPPIPKKSHRRSASFDHPPPHVLSPPPTRGPVRATSTTNGPNVPNAAALAARRSANLARPNELERSNSRNSINFSYPRGSRPNSPPPISPITPESPATARAGQAQGAAAMTALTAMETAQIKRNLDKTAAAPVKKNKKIVDTPPAQGTHLQEAIHEPPRAANTSSSTTKQTLGPQPAKKKNNKRVALAGESSHFPDGGQVSGPSDADLATDTGQDDHFARTAGTLARHPSVVHEDWEGERSEEQKISATPSTAQTNATATLAANSTKPPQANMSRKIGEPVSSPIIVKTAAASPVVTPQPIHIKKTLSPNTLDTEAARSDSISPSRSMRFSDRLASDLTAGRKHDPLGRSASPAKSAMKHHSPAPSDSSPIDPKFPQRRGSSVTPSEASDISTEGASKRKSVRVSFEASPEVVALVTSGEETPKSGKKGWFGLGKTKTPALGTIPAEDAMEEALKPRPALPSFGSVRKNRSADSPVSPGGQQDSVVSTRTPSVTGSPTSSLPASMSTSVSSDHAGSGVLFKDIGGKRHEPLPPQVTSVEGTGQVSDTESLASESDIDQEAASATKTITTSRATDVVPDGKRVNVPKIAVQPATPAPEDERPTSWAADVPGGFPANGNDSSSEAQTEETLNEAAAITASDPTGLGIERSEQESTVVFPTALEPSPEIESTPLKTIVEEETTDNDSLYSDAAEDLSDLEGDGFGSINAIVESPAVSSPAARVSSPPESPLASPSPLTKHDSTASWDDTQMRWNAIAQQSRDQAQQAKATSQPPAGLESPEVQAVKTMTQPKPKPKPKKKKTKEVATPAVPPSAPSAVARQSVHSQITQTLPSAPGQGSPMTLTQSKRASAPPTKNALLESKWASADSPAAARSTIRERPKSMAAASTQGLRSSQNKSFAPASQSSPLRRTLSNDSDSDSSFKKARRRNRPADGHFTMRRSMRGPQPAVTNAADNRAGDRREGVRSLSPVDRRPISPMRTLRSSMRGSVDDGVPSLRDQPQQRKRSSSLFGKASKAKSPVRAAIGAVALRKSRFADSDDEDEPRQRTYRSRYADSSDEDDREMLRPVRGIPRRNDEGDSTDLADSSDEERKRGKVKPKKLDLTGANLIEASQSPPLLPTSAKKRGFWGKLTGKDKKSVEPSSPLAAAVVERNDVPAGVGKSEKVSKQSKQLGFASNAQRDALVEQTLQKLEAARQTDARPTSPTGKLQRRMTPQRVLSDSWPLEAPKMPAAMENRPNSADGVGVSTLAQTGRPELGERQPTSETLRTSGGTAVYGKGGKKKKFPRLRRVFGLVD